METCHRCGTVLPTTPGARYCPNCGEMCAAASDPTQAFAAVGRGAGGPGGPGASGGPAEGPPAGMAGTTGMTWDLPAQRDATRALPVPGAAGFGAGPGAGQGSLPGP